MNEKRYVDHLITPNTITVVFSEGDPISIVRGESNAAKFNHIISLITNKDFVDIPNIMDKAYVIKVVTKGKFTVQEGTIVIDGEGLPTALSDKLLEMIDAGENTSYLENFWDNLGENPTDSARRDLYEFLIYNNVPITADGCIIVYKKVKDSYWDSYTGKTYQSKPGSVVKMPREFVDQNRNNTCSAGLHVAAYEYARNFSGTRLLECKVNPADVVAVPPDYRAQKMRVCRYEVLRETDKKYVEGTYDEVAPTKALGAGKFKPLRLRLDARGRLRIPGKAVRRLGLGVGGKSTVYVTTTSSRHIVVEPQITWELNKEPFSRADYTVDKDNALRLSDAMLANAHIDNYEEYIVRLKDSYLEIRVI